MLKAEFGDNFLAVTPGIRFEEEAADDQARLATPRIAIRNGSDILVMGRSLIKGGVVAVLRAYEEIYQGLLERLDLRLFKAAAIKLGSFKLKLHEKWPDAPLSPIYINIRNMPPGVYALMADIFDALIAKEGIEYDYILGIPKAGDPIAEALGRTTGKPVLHIEKIEIEGGRKIGTKILDPFEKKRKVLLVDDLVTQADTKREACKGVEENSLEVAAVVVGYDREQGGLEELRREGRKIFAARKMSQALDFYVEQKLVTSGKRKEVDDYKGAMEAFMAKVQEV
jgi:orotate phosphoribosyltransferase